MGGITVDSSELTSVDESPTTFPVIVEDILLKPGGVATTTSNGNSASPASCTTVVDFIT
jgi:hypothetical protein